MDICGDNRFEIIAKAKEHLLDTTNIDTSEDEMKVLDDFLFRCWQMGWLDRYAEQTELDLDLDKAKELLKEAVDSAEVNADIFANFIKAVYEQGKEDEHRWWSNHCANCKDAEQTETEECENGHLCALCDMTDCPWK